MPLVIIFFSFRLIKNRNTQNNSRIIASELLRIIASDLVPVDSTHFITCSCNSFALHIKVWAWLCTIVPLGRYWRVLPPNDWLTQIHPIDWRLPRRKWLAGSLLSKPTQIVIYVHYPHSIMPMWKDTSVHVVILDRHSYHLVCQFVFVSLCTVNTHTSTQRALVAHSLCMYIHPLYTVVCMAIMYAVLTCMVIMYAIPTHSYGDNVCSVPSTTWNTLSQVCPLCNKRVGGSQKKSHCTHLTVQLHSTENPPGGLSNLASNFTTFL